MNRVTIIAVFAATLIVGGCQTVSPSAYTAEKEITTYKEAEIAANGCLERFKARHFDAAYIDCTNALRWLQNNQLKNSGTLIDATRLSRKDSFQFYCLLTLARLYERRNSWSEAEQHYIQANELIRTLRSYKRGDILREIELAAIFNGIARARIGQSMNDGVISALEDSRKSYVWLTLNDPNNPAWWLTLAHNSWYIDSFRFIEDIGVANEKEFLATFQKANEHANHKLEQDLEAITARFPDDPRIKDSIAVLRAATKKLTEKFERSGVRQFPVSPLPKEIDAAYAGVKA